MLPWLLVFFTLGPQAWGWAMDHGVRMSAWVTEHAGQVFSKDQHQCFLAGDLSQFSWNKTQTREPPEKVLDLFSGISQLIHKGNKDVPPMVARKEWGARPLTCRALLTPPMAYVITDQLSGMECQEQNSCSKMLLDLQFHSVFTKGQCDVAYNFLVGDDGKVYEGVGWNIQGLHTQGYNNISLGIAFFGSKIACPNIVTRSAWGARETYCPKMNLPAKYVIIIHTAGSSCNVSMVCQDRVRDIQSFHMDKWNFCDIGYHFLVGQDGGVYEGVGWHIQGSHTYGYNDIALGIAFIGNFIEKPPNAAALEAAQDLIHCAVEKGYLTPNYLLVGHSDVTNILSPGQALYNIISTWPHFKH